MKFDVDIRPTRGNRARRVLKMPVRNKKETTEQFVRRAVDHNKASGTGFHSRVQRCLEYTEKNTEPGTIWVANFFDETVSLARPSKRKDDET